MYGFVTNWLRTSICSFRLSVPDFIFIKVTRDCYSNVIIINGKMFFENRLSNSIKKTLSLTFKTNKRVFDNFWLLHYESIF